MGAVALGEPVDVCVPCGNFGNILAAVYAKAMGVPFRDFTVAANKNNVLSDFVMTGKYDLRQRELLKTISPSIDILISSNIERMLHLLCAKNPEMADAGAEVDRCFKQLKTEGYFELSPPLFDMLNNTLILPKPHIKPSDEFSVISIFEIVLFYIFSYDHTGAIF